MGCFWHPPSPPYFAQSLRNRYFRLVPGVGVAIFQEQWGGRLGRVLSTSVVGHLTKT
jgi:hypothetical protein